MSESNAEHLIFHPLLRIITIVGIGHNKLFILNTMFEDFVSFSEHSDKGPMWKVKMRRVEKRIEGEEQSNY